MSEAFGNRQDVDEEVALLAKVASALASQVRGGADLVAGDVDKQMIEIRDALGEAKAEDVAPLVEQMTRLAALRSRLGGSQSIPVDPSSPYFAHMRLSDDRGERDILLGSHGFIDREAGVQIVDWRNSPISQIYYRYEQGDEFEEEIAGTMRRGHVLLKRNVSIHGGRLRRIGVPDGNWMSGASGDWKFISRQQTSLEGGAGVAIRVGQATNDQIKKHAALGALAGETQTARKQLPQIAALLDKAQYELISDPHQGLLVIQGGAGSGKTTVALHRMAYLAFENPRKFKPEKMMFVVPSIALQRYTKTLLPSLGVNGAKVHLYSAWARNTRRRVMPDSTYRFREDCPDHIVRQKKHPGIVSLITAYLKQQTEWCNQQIESLQNQPLLLRWHALAHLPLADRLSDLRRELSDVLPKGSSRVVFDTAIRRVLTRVLDVQEDWAEMLSDKTLVATHLPDEKDHDIAGLARRVINQIDAMEEADDAEASKETIEAAGFDPEDDTILLAIAQRKWRDLQTPNGKSLAYAHIAVDEAQDRTALDISVLHGVAKPNKAGLRSVTLAGDTAQQVVFDNAFDGWEGMVESLQSGAAFRELEVPYRSTVEIMSFANRLLHEPLPDVGSGRHGKPVAHFPMDNDGEVVAYLATELRDLIRREPNASIAVLTRHSEIADMYYQGLRRAEIPKLRRPVNGEFIFEPGIDVSTIGEVKGLEFDYVVLVRVNAGEYPNDKRAGHLLHVGATRAAHQLWMFSSGKTPELVERALSLE